MKTWLLCEAVAHAELTASLPRQTLIAECSDCAKACFAVVKQLLSNADDIGDLVFNCLLHCRRCSMECEKYPGEEEVQFCGMVSNICSGSMKNMAKFSLN
jgi:hypothetical protein